MVALIHEKPEKNFKGQPKYNVASNEHVCGGELLAKPDIAVVRSNLVLALGETKLRRADDGYVPVAVNAWGGRCSLRIATCLAAKSWRA